MESIVAIKDIEGEKKRVVVFMDDDTSVMLFRATVKEYGLKEGQVITADELKRIAKEGEEHIAFTTAMDAISRGPKSKLEIIKLLRTKKFSKGAIDSALEKLSYYNYLGDEDYARTYIDFKGNRTGRRKIIYELVTVKGIDKATAENIAYELLPDEKEIELATAMAEKYIAKEKKKRTRLRDKTYGFLASRGFDTDVILSVLDSVDLSDGDDEND